MFYQISRLKFAILSFIKPFYALFLTTNSIEKKRLNMLLSHFPWFHKFFWQTFSFLHCMSIQNFELHFIILKSKVLTRSENRRFIDQQGPVRQ